MLLPYLLIIYYYLQDAIKLAEIFKIKPKYNLTAETRRSQRNIGTEMLRDPNFRIYRKI